MYTCMAVGEAPREGQVTGSSDFWTRSPILHIGRLERGGCG